MNKSKYASLFKPQKSNLAIFHDLMPFKVREILLVATVYDAYILEREGQLFEQIYGEYYQVNIPSAPRITSVYSVADAEEQLSTGVFDLVIIVTGVNKAKVSILSKKVNEMFPDLPVLLLINNNNQISEFEKASDELIYIKKMFVWNGDSNIFLAMIKYIEDQLNAINDTIIGDVRVILVVEDSIKYYSRYLPTLYFVIMKEMQRLISGEDIDARYKVLKMRARPKILLVSNYEEALKVIEQYKEYLLCLITDVKFPQKGILDKNAGKDLVKHVKKHLSIPVLVQSSDPENRFLAQQNGVGYIDKNSDNISRDLVEFLQTNLGFGDFVFRTTTGEVIARARYMKEFEIIIDQIPVESLIYHSDRNDFSTWFMAKGEIKSALELKNVKTQDFKEPEEIRNFVKKVLRNKWIENKRDSIPNFSEETLRETNYLMRISNGSVGGKGRGIAFTESLLQNEEFKKMLDDICVTIPRTIIVGTDNYESFIDQAGFTDLVASKYSYDDIRHIFSNLTISKLLSNKLKRMLLIINKPIAVRSSGIFEDSLSQPFAGIYETFFLPNNHPDIEERLKQLELAIKMVYASVFSPVAKSYFDSINHSIEEEKMAVVIQELVGNVNQNYYYPHISGVAQSYNYYPVSRMKSDDGLALLAVGLGKTVVEGEESYRFCPNHPKINMVTIKDLLKYSQRYFYALDLNHSSFNLEQGSNVTLVKLPITEAEKHGTLTMSASVFDSATNSLRPGLHTQGSRILDFSYILQYEQIPLAKTIQKILDLMKSALGSAVEIEFSVDLTKNKDGKATFNILQVKPLTRSVSSIVVDLSHISNNDLILNTDKSMGNGIIENIRDLIYVIPENFNKLKTVEMAKVVSNFNAQMKKNKSGYVLIGPGRWGSSDPLLGIPVDWQGISEAKVIVEASLKNFNIDASLGSHFFHNITSMNIGYFTVSSREDDSFIDYNFLNKCSIIEETEYLRHIRFDEPVTIIMDGCSSKAVISKPGIKIPLAATQNTSP